MPLFRLLLEITHCTCTKKLLPTCFKVYTSIRKPLLLCSQAPRHLVIKSFLYHQSRHVFSFIKVHRFILLLRGKITIESRELYIFQSVVTVLKKKCGLLELWKNFVLHSHIKSIYWKIIWHVHWSTAYMQFNLCCKNIKLRI